MATQQQSFVDKRKGDTMINILIGAAIAFVAGSTLPFIGQVLGGAASGYLQQESRMSGVKVGAIASAIAALPGVLVVFLIFGFGFFSFLAGGEAMGGVILVVILVLVVAFAMAIAGALGGIGGYLGAMMAED